MSKIVKINPFELINLYLSGKSARELAIKYNCDPSVISKRLKRYNINIRPSLDLTTKYTLNKNYFNNIDTPDKAYFLGLLYADGYVDKNLGRIQLSLQNKDLHILETFKTYIDSNTIIRNKFSKSSTDSKVYHSNNLTVYSRKMANSLYKAGCYKGKSLTLTFPKEEVLPNYLQSHFIRGYFDGDGCVNITLKKLSWNIVGTFDMVNTIKSIIETACDLNNVKIQKDKNIFKLTYGGNIQVKRIYDWLYKDCGDLYLKRKKEKFENEEVKPFIPSNSKKCTIEGCNTLQNCNGLCKKHFDQDYLKKHKRVRVKQENGKYKSTYIKLDKVLNSTHL